MDKVKAGAIMEILINLDYMPTLEQSADGSYKIIVTDSNGVLVNTLKNFQDANQIIVKAVVANLT
jgi:hypothetical protein